MNHHLVVTRFNEMGENLKILEEFKVIAFAEFVGDPKIYKLAERCFQPGQTSARSATNTIQPFIGFVVAAFRPAPA
jgi:hypothetical protein